MSRVKSVLFKLYERKLLASILLSVLLLLKNVLLFNPEFETNDDNTMSGIISGFYGDNEAHLIFANIIIGLVLKPLYVINQHIPWYELFQLGLCLISMIAITFFLFSTIRSKYNALIVVVFDCIVAYELFVKVQFTKTAGISITAGILLIIYCTIINKISKKRLICTIFGVFLACMGACVREDMFLPCCFLSLSTVIAFLIKNDSLDRKVIIKRLSMCFVAFVSLIILMVGAKTINGNAISSLEWEEYYHRQHVVSQIYDYYCLNYDEEKLANSSLTLDESDKKMLERLNYDDTEFFTTAKLEAISETLSLPYNNSRYPFVLIFIVDMIINLIIKIYIPFVFFAILAFLVLLRNDIKSKDSIFVLLLILIMVGLYFYLDYTGRAFLNRVDCIMWFITSIPLLMIMNKGKRIKGKGTLAIMLVMLVLFYAMNFPDYRLMEKHIASKQDAREVFSVVANDTNHLYISTAFGVDFYKAYGLFDDIPKGGGTNFCYIGGWIAHAPLVLNNLEKYGIKHPLSDIINNDNVYLIDEDIDGTIKYIRHHYDGNARAILKKKINTHYIYKIVS